ncbi:histone-lysine N-methyltransferase SUVR5-like isoform X1 [Vicia villosa]|uniref:histone-lysine N-methyltransferase SUVR5-like isoform X1 n=1 Tax=Vicia villosa TaxID=3911 RepID=UPI00273AFF80|nr:histone-lysine N-methyltransferase SUVR5-like isoform X1 [Vicia villosa]XP_058760232.1 histone-lysine N-methyltransferase SUVR5-like isoform X1 [Vicia villosa]XP_058760233.1 histone-lysine N-methyltransferase SUVR5-like isoform X1 [Vicia villosa]XP_058760234.1 histone-lysine N-methyltransferase SUVR5-like isoform X1 [Vicia villosa]
MEVLPCSGVQYAGESDCPQRGSETTFIYQEEPSCPENAEHAKLADDPLNESLHNMQGPEIEMQDDGTQNVCAPLTNSNCQCNGASCCDCQAEDQKNYSGFVDFDDEMMNERYLTSENSLAVHDTIENESPNNGREGDLSFSEPQWLEGDESVALWVKWRGKWLAGIRCARADWPLSTLRAKPTHDRKKYFVIFFPHTKIYSWADTLLVRSIDEFPHPVAYKTHQVGLKLVRDLTAARRFIMQKLVVGMLNIVDQFHLNALTEIARDVKVWKAFAMEASHSNGYSDFGRMLLKIHNSILGQYIRADWLQYSSHSWVERCQSTNSAESVELLKEELFDSILWNDVNNLWDSPAQPILGSEWKTWKHDVTKWFSASPSLSSSKDTPKQISVDPYQTNLQASRKRPKLEVRRADTHASKVEFKGSDHTIALVNDPGFFKNQETLSTLTPEAFKHENIRNVSIPNDMSSNLTNNWNEIVVEAADSGFLHAKEIESTPINEMVAVNSVDPGSKNRQCIAFIEAKGRQCVRWANEGDVYCCVHLSSRFLAGSANAENPGQTDTPMCDGTTVVGTKCKHRALPGSLYCKKHRPNAETEQVSWLPQSTIKKKHEESYTGSENMFCKDIVLVKAEGSLQVDPAPSIAGDSLHGENNLSEKPMHYVAPEAPICIGSPPFDNTNPCREAPKRYSLYCEIHLPSWLKRARNGKSRIVSKEVFSDLLRGCSSWEQKIHLHEACELFYRLFKSILSLRNQVPKDVQFQWALTEASKEFGVGEFFTKLVLSEKERIKSMWGFNDDMNVSSVIAEEQQPPLLLLPPTINQSCDDENAIKCKICSTQFPDDQTLGNHWMDSHKKEAQWLFRGYACAICLDSFTNKKLLETHVQERHHVQFVEQCMLLQCIPCGSHFGNSEQLWQHVLSSHHVDFKPSKAPEQQTFSTGEGSRVKHDQGNSAALENNSENPGGPRRFICRFCGLKFDLLPDLGRHHQAAHMAPNLVSNRPAKRGVRYYAYKLKTGRLSRPRFKKSLAAAASLRMRNKANANLKRCIQATKSIGVEETTVQPHITETTNISGLTEHQCSAVAKILFSEIQKTKPRPNNLDILSVARTACCKVHLVASLEEKFGALPERLYLKAAKLCSERNIVAKWHHEGFACPRGCNLSKDQGSLSPLETLPNGFVMSKSVNLSDPTGDEWDVDEFHCIIDAQSLQLGSRKRATVLCDDISFGKESVPVICVVDQEFLHSLNEQGFNEQDVISSKPWESFSYVTKPIIDQSLSLGSESPQLGCACSYSTCGPETCDHVYLFGNDYADAKDIAGKPMRGRFPYDANGRIILEEGYLVYECNHMCRCNKFCPNRILQNGVRVKLEVFKTEKKGWAVRAGETILRGTFVCEYIGEVLDVQEAHRRRERYGEGNSSYFYDISARVNDMSRLMEEHVQYVVDATKYGNVSRFINHSCSPNLVSHQVLIESMECERSHIGFYASRDISVGEELTYGFQYELVPGEGSLCLCGSSNCRERLY